MPTTTALGKLYFLPLVLLQQFSIFFIPATFLAPSLLSILNTITSVNFLKYKSHAISLLKILQWPLSFARERFSCSAKHKRPLLLSSHINYSYPAVSLKTSHIMNFKLPECLCVSWFYQLNLYILQHVSNFDPDKVRDKRRFIRNILMQINSQNQRFECQCIILHNYITEIKY